MPRKQHSHHFIYKTTCIITNRYYIGMHSTSDMNDGYLGSGKQLWYSIKKHGRDNHKIEHLEFHQDRKSLKTREAELVNEDLLKDPMCMNLVIGGEGGINSKFMEKLNDPFFRSEIGRKSKQSRITNYGYDPIIDIRKGTTHTEESKKRISLANKNKGTGKNNSQFGKCWIFHPQLKENKSIKKDQLQYFLNSGWIKGRNYSF